MTFLKLVHVEGAGKKIARMDDFDTTRLMTGRMLQYVSTRLFCWKMRVFHVISCFEKKILNFLLLHLVVSFLIVSINFIDFDPPVL